MVELRELELDVDAERDGVWATFDGDFELRVASSTSREYEDAYARAIEPHLHRMRSGTLPKEVEEQVDREVTARYLVRDWRGLTRDGAPVPCTPDEAVALLARPGMYRLLRFVRAVAANPARYRAALLEEARKNSPPA